MMFIPPEARMDGPPIAQVGRLWGGPSGGVTPRCPSKSSLNPAIKIFMPHHKKSSSPGVGLAAPPLPPKADGGGTDLKRSPITQKYTGPACPFPPGGQRNNKPECEEIVLYLSGDICIGPRIRGRQQSHVVFGSGITLSTHSSVSGAHRPKEYQKSPDD